MTKNNQQTLTTLAIYSLAIVWIFTGLTSIFFAPEIGHQLLQQAGFSETLADLAIYSGAIIDIALGIWLLSRYAIRLCCTIQVIIIVSYTLLLSVIAPEFWLHPFGPVTKNLPMLVLIMFVYSSAIKSGEKG
ncbi:NAD-dependent dehydratase [Thalassotalea litorea]|uniref:NAD-dependent dehydratase n=1 Tax=Thalassotalea litorea TaxID=2020715 RepID=A0A5R9IK77_9GAMM|nr:DoxX-like family protein [Thalassotalea litorea]TLU65692.1 NAD-dependent dehydratase [Thalassotalea litorea]